MRIVGGTAGGKRLQGLPKGLGIRPTSDKVREAIFDVLASAMPGGLGRVAIDLFAGTGALGIEALSRGVARAVFIEQKPGAVRILQENLRRAGFTGRARVVREDVERALPRLRAGEEGPFDLAFVDPPYGSVFATRSASMLVSEGLLGPGAVVVIESGARDALEDPPGLVTFRRKRYGDTTVAFLRQSAGPSRGDRKPGAAGKASSEV